MSATSQIYVEIFSLLAHLLIGLPTPAFSFLTSAAAGPRTLKQLLSIQQLALHTTIQHNKG